MADLAEEHTWRDTFADAAFSIAMVSVGHAIAYYSSHTSIAAQQDSLAPKAFHTLTSSDPYQSMLGWTGFTGPAPSPVSNVTLEERLLALFEAYDLDERRTVDIVLGDSPIIVRFSINALPDKSLEEGLFFDKLAASFLSLFGSWFRYLTKLLTHIVEFASQNSQH